MNAASETARKLLSVHEELLRHQVLNDLKVVMGTADGRRLLWQLVGTAGVFRQSFVIDAASTAFNEGRRSIGLELLARLQDEAPDLYLKAQSEHIEMQRKAQSLREAAEAESAHEQEENE